MKKIRLIKTPHILKSYSVPSFKKVTNSMGIVFSSAFVLSFLLVMERTVVSSILSLV